jgi:ribosomal protein S18 acetylase RimI-like enzyme
VPDYFPQPRPLQPADSEPARALVLGVLGVTPYVDRVLELLDAATRGDPETRAWVIERDDTAVALALFGPQPGTRDTWRLHGILLAPHIESHDLGRAMVDAVVRDVAGSGARLLIAELPADHALGRTLSLLRATGFQQEARIPHFYRDGVALLVLRRELQAAAS